MSETRRYNPIHDFAHTRESQDYKNMDYKDRVHFLLEELWGEWNMLEASIENKNNIYDELLDVLEQMGIDVNKMEINEDKEKGTYFIYTDEELLGCVNEDNTINYEQLKKIFQKEAEHRAKDLPVQDPYNKGEKFVDQIPLETDPKSTNIVTGSGEGFEMNHERFERKKHLLRIFRSRNLQFHPVFIDFDALSTEQKEKYGNMFRTIALDKRDGDVIHPGQYDVYVVTEKRLTFMVSDKYGEATYIVGNAPEDMEDIIKTIGFNKEKKDEAEYPVSVIQWPKNGKMEDWRELIENFLDDPDFSFDIVKEEKENHEYDEAPEGWLNTLQISNYFGKSRDWVLFNLKNILEKNLNKDWQREYQYKPGRYTKYYSPELIKLLRLEVEKNEENPVGWLTLWAISDNLRRGYGWCQANAEEILKENPNKEWKKEYLDKTGKFLVHYSPELIDLLRLKVEKHEGAPDGWLTVKEISEKFNKSYGWCEKKIKEILEKNIDKNWFGIYLFSKSNRTFLYYSTELIDILKLEVEKLDTPPEGWLTITEISRLLGKSHHWCTNVLKRFFKLNSNKEWSKKYLDKSDRLTNYYSPELIEILREEANNHMEAPEGWSNITNIADNLGKSNPWCQKRINILINNNPDKDWRREYIDGIGHINSYYPTELIDILKQEIDKYEKAPSGWLNLSEISKLLNKSSNWCINRIKKFLELNQHQEWSKKFLDTSLKITTHYSSELVELLMEESSKYDESPDEWMGLTQISNFINKGQQWCQKMIDTLIKNNPDKDWQKEYIDGTGHINYFYSPELIELLLDESVKHEEAPDGWMGLRQISSLTKKSRGWCIKRINAILKNNPDKNWEKEYLDNAGNLSVYYSSDLITALLGDIVFYEEVPKGWLSIKKIAKILAKTPEWCKNSVSKIIVSNPDKEWTKKFLSRNSNLNLYYSVDLIDKLKKLRDQEDT